MKTSIITNLFLLAILFTSCFDPNVKFKDPQPDSLEELHSKDSLNYYINTKYIKYSINNA